MRGLVKFLLNNQTQCRLITLPIFLKATEYIQTVEYLTYDYYYILKESYYITKHILFWGYNNQLNLFHYSGI